MTARALFIPFRRCLTLVAAVSGRFLDQTDLFFQRRRFIGPVRIGWEFRKRADKDRVGVALGHQLA